MNLRSELAAASLAATSVTSALVSLVVYVGLATQPVGYAVVLDDNRDGRVLTLANDPWMVPFRLIRMAITPGLPRRERRGSGPADLRSRLHDSGSWYQ